MVNEPGAGPGFFSGSARAADPSSAHSARGTRMTARLTREPDLTWMLMAAELPTPPARPVSIAPNSELGGERLDPGVDCAEQALRRMGREAIEGGDRDRREPS